MHRLFALLALLLLALTNPAMAKIINAPTIPVEQAVTIAKKHIQDNKIDISRHFLAKVEYFGLYDEYKKPFWRVEWRLLAVPPVKGGQIYVLVYSDGNSSHTFGE